jgi:hypothetical protein
VVSNEILDGVDPIRRTVVKTLPDGIVTVDDVATVRRSAAPQWIRVTADGHDAVLINVYQQPGGNSVQIARDIKARLDEIQSKLPPAVSIANWYDQSQLVTSSATSVRDAIMIGAVLAALVLLVFLRSWRVTRIALLVVPASLSATIVLLYALNMSFNIMTLGGMAAAVGLIIDDAIVDDRADRPRASGRRGRGRAGCGGGVQQAVGWLERGDGGGLRAAGFPQRRHRWLFRPAVPDRGVEPDLLVLDYLARRAARSRAAGHRRRRSARMSDRFPMDLRATGRCRSASGAAGARHCRRAAASRPRFRRVQGGSGFMPSMDEVVYYRLSQPTRNGPVRD